MFQTITGEAAYGHPRSGKFYIFNLHQCIHVDNLDHHMLCPMQCLMIGVDVNETPNFLLKRSTSSSHAIVVNELDGESSMIVPL